MTAGRTESMMIVIGPPQTQPILTRLLHPSRPVAALPIIALAPEDDVTGQVPTHHPDDALEQPLRMPKTFSVLFEPAPPQLPQFRRPQERFHCSRSRRSHGISSVASPFHDLQAGSIFRCHDCPPETGE